MNIQKVFLIVIAALAFGMQAAAQQVSLQPVKSALAPGSEGRVSTSGLTCMSAFLYTDLYLGNVAENELVEKYSLVRVDGRLYAPAFVEVESMSAVKGLSRYDVKINGEKGLMMSVMIPVDRFVEFAQSGICLQIDVAKKMDLDNEKATRMMRSDEANSGHMLPEKYDGTGVIVGIIDIGFEYGHPTFYDTTGTRYRVKCVWDQNVQCSTHPAGYSYGKEYLTQSAILNAVCSHTDETHGSHVAGIAAGSGGPTTETRQYRGVAPNAELVLVATTMMTTGIYDGISYIKSYASSLGRPCVINMSLGSQVGPHDGTTLFDQMCDTYVGNTPGVLLCSSAGNEGSTTLHLMKEFDDEAADTVVSSFLSFSGNSAGETYVDCWGMPGAVFGVQLGVVNTNTGVFEDVSYLYSSAYSTTYSTTLTDADGEVCTLDLYVTNSNTSNGRPNILVRVKNNNQTSNSQRICVRLVGHNTTVHCWANKANLESLGVNGVVSGDNNYTTGEIGIGRTMITVGSCMSRKNWTALNGYTYGFSGNEGQLSYFSSIGPSLDGRIKPDIIGPGQMLYSAVNKYDAGYCDPTGAWVVGSVTFNGATEYYAAMQGTSMSCPAVTGCMALWLQANPQLTSTQAHQLLHNSGIQDVYTGVIPPTGSTAWGWGKVNLYAGLPVTDDTIMDYECRITDFDYVENFESAHHCWTATDADASTTSWHYKEVWNNDPGIVNHNGAAALVSQPSERGMNHVLLSPEIYLPAIDSLWAFSWQAGSYDASGETSDTYEVYVVSGNDERLMYYGSLINQHTLVNQAICLDSFRGMNIRIKVVHHAGQNAKGITFDDLTIKRNTLVAPQVRIAYNGTLQGYIRADVGDTLELQAVVVNDAKVTEYQWTAQGNYRFIEGESGKTVKIVWNSDCEGWVNVHVANSAGDDSFLRGVAVGDVAVPQLDAVAVEVFPNPTKNVLTVSSASKIQSLEVVDAKGRTVLVTDNERVDLTTCAPGVYLLKVVTEKGVAVSRVVKQ